MSVLACVFASVVRCVRGMDVCAYACANEQEGSGHEAGVFVCEQQSIPSLCGKRVCVYEEWRHTHTLGVYDV